MKKALIGKSGRQISSSFITLAPGVIKYLGSKRTLLPGILAAVGDIAGTRSVLDLFSGTSRVGHALKGAGYRVFANDHNAYAEVLARCYVQADGEEVEREATWLIGELNAMPTGEAGYMTETFCVQSRYFHPRNGARIDTLRRAIGHKHLNPELEAVLLTSLMEAADRVDSTTGLQMAYLKEYAPRALNDLELRLPRILPRAGHGKGRSHRLDALEAARTIEADVAYVDPPYNQHSYLGNYHIWETLVRWDEPTAYGIACKREDVKSRQSPFNSRNRCGPALIEVLSALRTKAIVLSFSNEGFISREEMEAALAQLWGGSAQVRTVETDYKRYVGAQIGIYNPKGKKVGAVSHLRNKEYLYVVTRG